MCGAQQAGRAVHPGPNAANIHLPVAFKNQNVMRDAFVTCATGGFK
jgi:uncharacterized protein YjaZ